MKTIYAASSGEYSDYGVNALFDTRGLAEAYVEREKKYHSYSDHFVEEFTIHDELPKRVVRVRAYARLFADGTLEEVSQYEDLYDEDQDPGEEQVEERAVVGNRRGNYTTLTAYNFRSKEQAQKAIYDKAAELKARRAGIAVLFDGAVQ